MTLRDRDRKWHQTHTSFLNRVSIYFENAKWKDYDGWCIFKMAAANSKMAVMICTQLLFTLTETLGVSAITNIIITVMNNNYVHVLQGVEK